MELITSDWRIRALEVRNRMGATALLYAAAKAVHENETLVVIAGKHVLVLIPMVCFKVGRKRACYSSVGGIVEAAALHELELHQVGHTSADVHKPMQVSTSTSSFSLSRTGYPVCQTF